MIDCSRRVRVFAVNAPPPACGHWVARCAVCGWEAVGPEGGTSFELTELGRNHRPRFYFRGDMSRVFRAMAQPDLGRPLNHA